MRSFRFPDCFPSPRSLAFFPALLAVFILLAWLGVRGKCATFDEPLDSIEGWCIARYGDFRISPADPPLPYLWSALLQPRSALKADFNSQVWREAAKKVSNEHEFAANTLFRTPGNDADAFLARSRAMMLVLAALAAIVIAAWGFRLGGPACAAVAMTLFCLDPNILAHAALVKNDLSMALAAVSLMAAVWTVGRRASAGRLICLALLSGVILGVKFNGPLFGPVVALALVARATMRQPWNVLGRSLATVKSRLLAALAICSSCAVIAYVFVWGCYGFRFNPSSDPNFHLETREVVRRAVVVQLFVEHPDRLPTLAEVDATQPPLLARAAMFSEQHHLLPQSYTNGLMRINGFSTRRSMFLLGQYSDDGWWYYFPLAFVFKTPLATLVAIAIAPWILLRKQKSPVEHWGMICLTLPIVVYGLAAITGHLNLGIRHLFPIYPFVFLALGLVFVRYWQWNRKYAGIGAAILSLGLAGETLSAFPNFIPFFNIAFGGSRGGLSLLSDSNIDWGQDLKLLARWQQNHRGTPLYLCYFGTTDPRYYSLHYINLPGSYALSEDGSPPPEKMPMMSNQGVMAISATSLQATYLPQWRKVYPPLMDVQPIEVLGGSIYLFPLGKDKNSE